MIKADGSRITQDWLTGMGSFRRLRSSLDTLLDVGFAHLSGRYTRLGIAPCATQVNFMEIPDIWRFARRNNIFPNVEIATAIGRASANITLRPSQLHWLNETLKAVDEQEFGIEWFPPYSAIPAHSCGVFLGGAAVTVERGVSLCPEMRPVANLADKPLAQILKEPPFSIARALEQNIAEPCASCEFIGTCLGGCRSKALQCGGSIFAPDPYCTVRMGGQAVLPRSDEDEENGIPLLATNRLRAQMSGELLSGAGNLPVSWLAARVVGESEVGAIASIELVLKSHLRAMDRIQKIRERSMYLLTLTCCDAHSASNIEKRIRAVFRSLNLEVTLHRTTLYSSSNELALDDTISDLGLLRTDD